MIHCNSEWGFSYNLVEAHIVKHKLELGVLNMWTSNEKFSTSDISQASKLGYSKEEIADATVKSGALDFDSTDSTDSTDSVDDGVDALDAPVKTAKKK